MATRNPRRFRPRLEGLESREVPSGLTAAALASASAPAQSLPGPTLSPIRGAGQAFIFRQTRLAKNAGGTLGANLAGYASQLDRFTGQLNLLFAPDFRHFAGIATLHATNGDVLNLNVYGSLSSTAPSSRLNGTFVVEGGSGRFAGAGGHGTITGSLDAKIRTLAFTFHGTILELPVQKT